MRDLVADAARFGLVGIANTLVGLGITAGLDIGLHLNPNLANAAGYGGGMVLSYFLNRRFVFRHQARTGVSAPKFAAAMAIAFAVNQLVLVAAGKLLGAAPEARLLAQILAMGSYTVTNFVLCRMWVFRRA